ncbi:hypothetical protein L1049_021688 [Liquidambar formosana]|uniref:Pre-nudix hydrolase domain-containing protein n=1 Tax=Liquidambar formosana TaxID=63359 RepID=A0AAP0RCI2_LIQFO
MECKLFDSKSLSMSEIAHVGRTFSSPFSYSRSLVGVKVSPEFCSCRGIFPKGSYSRTSNKGNGFVGQEKIAVETCLYQINGTNGSTSSLFSRGMPVLDASDDEYDGVIVNPDTLPANPIAFASILRSSLSHWKMKGKKGIWLKLPLERSELVPIAVKEGFEYHHAEQGYVMLTYWIPDGPCMLPANASHQVGVGGFVINDKNEVLVVQEKYCCSSNSWSLEITYWFHCRGMFCEFGPVSQFQNKKRYAAIIKEFQFILFHSIDTEFVEVIAFRHAHNVAFEKSDLFFICMLRPLSTQILVDDLEIQAAKWMPLVEFVEQPLIQGDSMFKKIIDICIAKLRKRYCGLSAHQVVSKFDGKSSSLYYSILENQDFNCQGY